MRCSQPKKILFKRRHWLASLRRQSRKWRCSPWIMWSFFAIFVLHRFSFDQWELLPPIRVTPSRTTKRFFEDTIHPDAINAVKTIFFYFHLVLNNDNKKFGSTMSLSLLCKKSLSVCCGEGKCAKKFLLHIKLSS